MVNVADKVRIKVPSDNYGRVYIGMLESDLSSAAKLCYGVMWSFGGQDAWASLESIGRRMSVSKPTVIKAQEELRNAGWIELEQDSKGRKCKEWRLFTHEDREANGKLALPLTVKPLYPNKEGKKESTDTPIPKAKTKDQQDLDTLQALWSKHWSPKLNENYLATKKDTLIFKGWVKAGVTPEVFEQKVVAYLQVVKDYHKNMRYPLWLLESTWNELQAGTVVDQRNCDHPFSKLKVLTDYGQSVKGVCGVCKKTVTQAKP